MNKKVAITAQLKNKQGEVLFEGTRFEVMQELMKYEKWERDELVAETKHFERY